MSQKSFTPDERFLLALYQTASQAGDLFQEHEASRIARAVSLKQTALKNIVKHLAQANFIKKEDEALIKLTKQGRDFVELHLGLCPKPH